MKHSEALDKLLPALHKAQGAFEHAKKESNNPHFKSKYADLATVLDTVKPALQENGLTVTHQRHVDEHLNEYITTTLWHTSGQYVSSTSLLNPTKKDPQGFGSAITYARRYDLSALVGLASDDDDGNAASQEVPKKSAAAMKKQYAEIKEKLEASDDPAAIWHENKAEIDSFKVDAFGNSTLYDQLVEVAKKRKQELQLQNDFKERA